MGAWDWLTLCVWSSESNQVGASTLCVEKPAGLIFNLKSSPRSRSVNTGRHTGSVSPSSPDERDAPSVLQDSSCKPDGCVKPLITAGCRAAALSAGSSRKQLKRGSCKLRMEG